MPIIIMDHKKKSRQLSFNDNPRASEILKIGREINRYKQRDGCNIKGIEQRFGKDANALCRPKVDNSWVKDFRRDVNRELNQKLKGA